MIRQWGVLAVSAIAQLIVVLDVSVVNIALPQIGMALDITGDDIQWVAGGYTLAFAATLMVGARLADTHGIRRVFISATVVFVVASVVGGLATSGSVLIASRIVQGLAASVLSPASFTLLTISYAEGPRRTRAVAIWTAVSVAGGGIGNIVGGALTEYVSWRSVLLINLPIGIGVLILASRHVRGFESSPSAERPTVNVAGAVLIAGGLGGCTLAVAQLGERGSEDLALSAAVVGVAALIGFVVQQRRSTSPLIPHRLLTNRIVLAGNVLTLFTGAVFQAPLWFFLTFQMQQSYAWPPLRTALGFLPLTTVLVVTSVALTPRLLRRHPTHRVAAAGAALAAAGLVWAGVATDSDFYFTLIGSSILIGLGGGLLNTPLATAVTNHVSVTDAGAASGLMNTSKQFGGALGLTALTVTAGLAEPRLAYAYMALVMGAVAISSLALLRTR